MHAGHDMSSVSLKLTDGTLRQVPPDATGSLPFQFLGALLRS